MSYYRYIMPLDEKLKKGIQKKALRSIITYQLCPYDAMLILFNYCIAVEILAVECDYHSELKNICTHATFAHNNKRSGGIYKIAR